MFVGCGCCTRMGWGLWVIEEWGGRCFIMVSWFCHGVLCCCHVAPFQWLPCHPVGDVAPVSVCEKRMEDSNRYLAERIQW